MEVVLQEHTIIKPNFLWTHSEATWVYATEKGIISYSTQTYHDTCKTTHVNKLLGPNNITWKIQPWKQSINDQYKLYTVKWTKMKQFKDYPLWETGKLPLAKLGVYTHVSHGAPHKIKFLILYIYIYIQARLWCAMKQQYKIRTMNTSKSRQSTL